MKNWPKKARVAWALMVIAALAVAGYLIADHFKPRVPQLEEGVGVWQSEETIIANPGGFNIATVTFLNGKDADRIFYITLQPRNPNKIPDGYEALPEEYYDWFTMPEEGIPVKAGGYCEVKIPIFVPYDTDYLDKHAIVMVQGIGFDPEAGINQIGAASIWYIIVTATEE